MQMASSSLLSKVEHGSFGPIRASEAVDRFFHLATVFGLMPRRSASALMLA